MLTCSIRSRLALTVILVIMAGCRSEPVSVADDAAVAVEPEAGLAVTGRAPAPRRAWRIQAMVDVTPAPPPAGCVIYFTSLIEGHATHLGAFSGVGSTCITDATQPDPDPPFLPAGPPPYMSGAFTNPLWKLTASNGDELWLESVEAVFVISLTDQSLRAQGRHRILGGTGRFAGATGEAMVGAVNDDGQGPDDFSGSGWIRFRAADRAVR